MRKKTLKQILRKYNPPGYVARHEGNMDWEYYPSEVVMRETTCHFCDNDGRGETYKIGRNDACYTCYVAIRTNHLIYTILREVKP